MPARIPQALMKFVTDWFGFGYDLDEFDEAAKYWWWN